jgi:hypothetical protein
LLSAPRRAASRATALPLPSPPLSPGCRS